MTTDTNGRRTVQARTALLGIAGSTIAAVVGVLGILSFFGATPAAVRDRERRIVMLEMRNVPEPAVIEDLARQLVAVGGQIDVLSEKIDGLNRRLDRVEGGR